MESIIHRRLMRWPVEDSKLHFYLIAYQTNHSTVGQLFFMYQSIIEGLQEKLHRKTVSVLLDLSAAFDRVWRKKLIHVIYTTAIKANALLWINNFLRERRFSLRSNGVLFWRHRMGARSISLRNLETSPFPNLYEHYRLLHPF